MKYRARIPARSAEMLAVNQRAMSVKGEMSRTRRCRDEEMATLIRPLMCGLRFRRSRVGFRPVSVAL